MKKIFLVTLVIFAISARAVDRNIDPQCDSLLLSSWSQLPDLFSSLDPNGKFSAALMSDDFVVKLTHNDQQRLGTGSTFKLYILGALQRAIANGEHHWNEFLDVKEDRKSFPSGLMQDWPAGSTTTLYDFAEMMIAISDNTATDHLVYLLGHDKVDAMTTAMGNTHAELPVLSTLQMFKLLWAIKPEEVDFYFSFSRNARKMFLKHINAIPRARVGQNGVDATLPSRIDNLEWLATSSENCKAMFALASTESSAVRSILSRSTPFVEIGSDSSHWSYVGYKGGSMPGTISMTYLLESKTGKRACLSMTWNNSQKNVSQDDFFNLVKRTLKFAETQIP